tara:strand:- start:2328 stop:3506 length:1179 start_codon:yes stop_codon:yes gene_type:complete
MARLIQSIFSGGKTGATGSGGFTDEELSDYQKALMRGASSAGKTGNPITAAAGGLLGQLARKKFFPTDEEKANKASKSAYETALDSGIDPINEPNKFQMELAKYLAAAGSELKNSSLTKLAMEYAQGANENKVSLATLRAQREAAEVSLENSKLEGKSKKLAYQKTLEEIENDKLFVEQGLLRDKDDIKSAVTKFADDYRKDIGDAFKVKRSFEILLNAENTAAGGFFIVNTLAKLLDPTSAITSEEFKAIAGLGSFRQKLETALATAKDGKTIDDKILREIREEAFNIYKIDQQNLAETTKFYREAARGVGINDNLINNQIIGRQDFSSEEIDAFISTLPDPKPEPKPKPDTSEPKVNEVVKANNDEPVVGVLSDLGVFNPPQDDEDENNQ